MLTRESWAPDLLGPRPTGSRTGWWGLGAGAESYLDQLLTWRELALNGALNLPGYDDLTGNPAWAQRTLDEHRADVRAMTYTDEALASASTHDPVWNAAQRELVQTGGMHTFLRMLWGKKVLEWSDTPEQAFSRLVHLNNRYALDGRDPNSYAGIAWVFGRYDRAWGPERPIYGKVRYMTSESTRRKLRMRGYLERWGP